MLSNKRLTVLGLIIASLLLAACGAGKTVKTVTSYFKLEEVKDSSAKRITLVQKAAERLDIQTAEVREEQVTRKRTVGGRVIEVKAADGSTQYVRVRLVSASELSQIDSGKPVTILPIVEASQPKGIPAQKVDAPAGESADSTTLYYKADAASGLQPGQRVLVELALKGSGTPQKVVPYASVIYGLKGETWVYTSPAELTFIRDAVKIDYIEGDLAILTEGPTKGTKIVTVGVAELFGIEFGIGK